MPSRYIWSLVLLGVVATGQFWFAGVLVLCHQMEALLLGNIMACVFWAWCLWAYWLRKRRGGAVLTGFCLSVSLILVGLLLLDMLDQSGVLLRGA